MRSEALLILMVVSSTLHSSCCCATSIISSNAKQQGTAAARAARATWQWYRSSLSSRPLLTKATTSAVIVSISDVACQSWEVSSSTGVEDVSKKPPNNKVVGQDWERTSHVAITGFTFSGPISHVWYTILESIVGRVVIQEQKVWGIALRMLLDAFLFSPVAVAGYFTWRTLLEGKGLDGVHDKLQHTWKGALLASWHFWPLVNIVNFSVVPVQYRVLYNNSLSFLWNGYLTQLNAKRLLQEVAEKQTT
jgi:protein Mpv17